MPAPGFAVLVVYEPFVVSVFREFVFVESGVAGADALIKSVLGVVAIGIPIRPFHRDYMIFLSLILFQLLSCFLRFEFVPLQLAAAIGLSLSLI